MNLRAILLALFAFVIAAPELSAKPLLSGLKEEDEFKKADEKRNVLIFRASDSLLRFSQNSESYRLGGGYQRRIHSKCFDQLSSFSKSIGTYFEYQSNRYGDDRKDQIFRAYLGMQFDYINPHSAFDGAFLGIYPALGVTQSHSDNRKNQNSTVGGILAEAGKSFHITGNLLYRPNIGYRKFAGKDGEVLIRPLEFAFEF